MVAPPGKPPIPLYIALLSVHGLFRGDNPELGRDADTGGQIKYVLELARTLGEHPQVERVDLLTRRVLDAKVDPLYGEPRESIAPRVNIVRINCGPRRYLRKEVLWPHLDSFIDNALRYFRQLGRTPDIIHAHYADAGYIGARLTQLLGVPLVFTGHSLGRVKRQRLLAQGVKPASIEKHYNINQRIEAEEISLGNASAVIASTRQEVQEQYAQYENYHPRRMTVLPPGIALDRFHPPADKEATTAIERDIALFLKAPNKPMILALSRPDARKNIAALLKAFGEHPQLRQLANLVIIAGNRDDIRDMEKGPQEVLQEMLLLIDRYDLYGSVAYPKHHLPEEVPALFRLAARRHGVFINPALTEPFGLTLIEAAASGLPIVATHDGGPNDIVNHCRNGLLIDPLDTTAIGDALWRVLNDKRQWRQYARNGISGVRKYYFWPGHVEHYVSLINGLRRQRRSSDHTFGAKSRLPAIDRLMVCDIDNTLIGDPQATNDLVQRMRASALNIGFAVATGRRLQSALKVIRDHHLPMPDVLITSVGTEIHYGHHLVPDQGFERHINHRWDPAALRNALADMPGLKLQNKEQQGPYKVSYFVDPRKMAKIAEIKRHLRRLDLHCKIIYSHQAYIDLVPERASKGMAIRYLALRWGIEPERILVAGDSGSDEEMLGGNTLAVVVGNHSPELDRLQGKPHVYFADGHCARGVIEGIDHYNFLGQIHIPEEQLHPFDTAVSI